MDDQTVYVVTRDTHVLATFTDHQSAITYVERDDVGGEFGEWSDRRHTYTSRHGLYKIWNQTVWP